MSSAACFRWVRCPASDQRTRRAVLQHAGPTRQSANRLSSFEQVIGTYVKKGDGEANPATSRSGGVVVWVSLATKSKTRCHKSPKAQRQREQQRLSRISQRHHHYVTPLAPSSLEVTISVFRLGTRYGRLSPSGYPGRSTSWLWPRSSTSTEVIDIDMFIPGRKSGSAQQSAQKVTPARASMSINAERGKVRDQPSKRYNKTPRSCRVPCGSVPNGSSSAAELY